MPDRLGTYRKKRDFAVTPEPSGTSAAPARDGNRFVVQRHRATRLHYDLRLEAAGVLLSWAVPKGPTLDPDARRMAVHVEDHPLEYFDFEGVIPAGEYGGGDVIVWDWGTWSLAEADDPLAAVEAGNLHFDLHGEKLRGRFVLVRRGRGGKQEWLLLHKHDEDAVPGWEPEEHPRSVKSGRTNDEVKAAPAASWSSDTIWAAPDPDELAALDALDAGGNWRVGEHTVRLTDLDRTVIAAARKRPAVTKRDLVLHYTSMAPVILPYVADRPVHGHRSGSWVTTLPARAPAWMPRADGSLRVDSAAALAWVANHGVVELHAELGTTWAAIAVDPRPKVGRDDVLLVAGLVRAAVEHLRLASVPMLTGDAVHVMVPVAKATGRDRIESWVDTVTTAIGSMASEVVGSVRLGRPDRAGTFVVPFSVRATAGAPVVVPVTWDELEDAPGWDVRSIGARLDAAGDPLAPLIGRDQRLPKLG